MSQTLEASPPRAPSITAPAPVTATSNPVPEPDHEKPQASEKSKATATLDTHVSQTTAAGLVAAVAFGVFAVKSVKIATDANSIADVANTAADKQASDAYELAMAANRLALLTLCLTENPQISNISSICAPVIQAATTVLPKLATSLFPASSTSAISTLPPSSGSNGSSGARVGMIAGIVVAVVVVLLLLGWLLLFIRRFSTPKRSSDSRDRGVAQRFRRLFMDTRLITKEE